MPSTLRYARTNRSNCDAVCTSACSNNVDSGTRPATLVAARTFEYDNRPAANAASSNGNPVNADATRTYSRAAPGATALFERLVGALETPALAHAATYWAAPG